MFEIYYEDVRKNTTKQYYSFVGIAKKDFPKWEGWKIIIGYKDLGVLLDDIQDERLDILVENFYRLKYLQEKFLTNFHEGE